jgi:hypothetical protein
MKNGSIVHTISMFFCHSTYMLHIFFIKFFSLIDTAEFGMEAAAEIACRDKHFVWKWKDGKRERSPVYGNRSSLASFVNNIQPKNKPPMKRENLRRCVGRWSKQPPQKPNSWMDNFVEVSGHNLESSQTWGFCMDLSNHREGGKIFLLSPLHCTVIELKL